MIKQLLRERKRISILDRPFVEPMVVDARSKTVILFRCKKHWGSIGGYRRSDVAVLKHVPNLFLCLLELERAELIDWPLNGWSVILQFSLELVSHSY